MNTQAHEFGVAVPRRPCGAVEVVLGCAFLLVGLAPASAAQTVSLRSLLREMTGYEALTRFPRPAYSTVQCSSYDRASRSPEDAEAWFANADAGKFLREEQVEQKDGTVRTEYVMAECDGPGAIVRIWSANPGGTLRVYVDGKAEVEMMMAQALGGGLAASPLSGVRARGFNLHLPIPFAKSVKVTSDKGDFYYHVQVRRYERGTRVESFDMRAYQQSMEPLGEARDRLSTPPEAQGETHRIDASIPGGSTGATLTLPDGPGAARVLKLTAPADALTLRSLVLVCEFDGEQTVWCPVSDFFGIGVYGLGASGKGVSREGEWTYLSRGYFMDARSNEGSGTARPRVELTSRFVMPYAWNATVRVLNLGRHEANVSLSVVTSPYEWGDDSMHFAASWRQERDMPTRPMRDFRMTSVRGRGVLVGDALAIANPVEAWWGEGDEKIFVDGEAFPSHFGTGTEDYYGYAWCSNEPFAAAFHAQSRCDGRDEGGNYGHSSVARWRSLDAIPFERSIDFDMELWHWEECEVTYAATAWMYLAPFSNVRVVASPDEVRAGLPKLPAPPPPFRVNNSVECEDMEVIGVTPGVPRVVQEMRRFRRGVWSNERHLWVQAKDDGDAITLRVPSKIVGPVSLELIPTESWDYAKVRVRVNDKVAAESIDLNSRREGVARVGAPIYLGVHEAAAALEGEDRQESDAPGELFLTIEVIGTSSGGRFFGLDCVMIKPPEQ